jgi:hypothetical protein
LEVEDVPVGELLVDGNVVIGGWRKGEEKD